jgi:hypothetical protein
MFRSATPMFRRLPALSVAALLVAPVYAAYLVFILTQQQAGVDYHTFVLIGQRFLDGYNVYTFDNSYYPLPYVMIFAVLAALPSVISIALWHMVPLVAVLMAARWQAWPLLFAPVFAHFVGGQTSVVGLLAVYGFLRYRDEWYGGAWLAVAMLKPQLALLPLLWCALDWWPRLRHRQIPPQAAAFVIVTGLIYLPSLIIAPTWPLDWLSASRPLFERAMAGFVPRTLVILMGTGPWMWLAWAGVTLPALLFLLRRRPDFATFLLVGSVFHPLIHDYDLIQLVPVLNTPHLQRAALLASVPTWVVIVFAYGNDRAWYVVTLIPLVTAWVAWRER